MVMQIQITEETQGSSISNVLSNSESYARRKLRKLLSPSYNDLTQIVVTPFEASYTERGDATDVLSAIEEELFELYPDEEPESKSDKEY